MRIIFAGTPEFAAGHLRYLLEKTTHEIVAVFTQPDRPAGRGKKLTASPVKETALSHQLPVYQPVTLRDKAIQEQIAQLKPDVMVVVAYGLILPSSVLSIPPFGCLNVHASLLPRWRGAAPIQRSIEAGDTETGITIMQMDEGLDTGAMLLKVNCSIAPQETSASLHDKLMSLGSPALTQVLQAIENKTVQTTAQDNTQASYASKINKTEAKLDWQQAAADLERKVRAFNPFPIAYIDLKGESVRIWQALALNEKTHAAPGTILKSHPEGIDVATGEGVLRLTQLQLPGKKAFTAAEILNGHGKDFSVGQQLG